MFTTIDGGSSSGCIGTGIAHDQCRIGRGASLGRSAISLLRPNIRLHHVTPLRNLSSRPRIWPHRTASRRARVLALAREKDSRRSRDHEGKWA